MYVEDILDLNQLHLMVGRGYIRVQTHPDDDRYRIFNYTEKASFERVWNRSTRLCRGLIVGPNEEVLAIPFPKFHNSTEPEAASFDSNSLVDVYDKVDGSCGIFYVGPDGLPAIATRGSFASDQAIHATHVLRTKYGEWVKGFMDLGLQQDVTLMFEIVYPENRIVLNYGDQDDLIYLGAVALNNGAVLSIGSSWPGPKTEALAVGVTMAEALALPNRDNAEGVVIRIQTNFNEDYWDVQQQVKVKQADYVALHKIVTNLSDRAIWEQGPTGDIDSFISVLPDEFHEWAKETHDILVHNWRLRLAELSYMYSQVVRELPVNYSRKELAMALQSHPDKGYLFSIEDGKNIQDKIWQEQKPAAVDKLGVEV